MDDIEERSSPYYPRRKRTSVFNDLSESGLEQATSADADIQDPPLTANHAEPNRQSSGGLGGKGTFLGTWRDSVVPEPSRKHAVIGFIDVRDRLRTRILPNTKEGESLEVQYPLPPGPGGSWVTFERIVFSDHLVGLDQLQVKEYTRLRSNVWSGAAQDAAAVQEAIRRVKKSPSLKNPAQPPAIARGINMPEDLPCPWPDLKRKRSSGGFASINAQSVPSPSHSPAAAYQSRLANDPLPGTRPTRILVGYWKPSNQADPRDRHAGYGILGKNDMFRVKVVRQSRDGRYIDGNFPSGAGALWVPYEEVEFEPHLRTLNRQQVKEYCRVRQFQLDNGERSKERVANEAAAVYEAQSRAGIVPHEQPHSVTVRAFAAVSQPAHDVRMNERPRHEDHEHRQPGVLNPHPVYASSSGMEPRALGPQADSNDLRERKPASHMLPNLSAPGAATLVSQESLTAAVLLRMAGTCK